jgi:hypothetical protein
MVAAAALLAAVGGLGDFAGASGLRLPRPPSRNYHPPCPNAPTRPLTQPPAVRGEDRNAPCQCGCGKKRKKCPNGIKNIPAKAHNLSLDEYRKAVYDVIAAKWDFEVAEDLCDLYGTSHIDSYWKDEVIEPAMCARLLEDMYAFDMDVGPSDSCGGEELSAEVGAARIPQTSSPSTSERDAA